MSLTTEQAKAIVKPILAVFHENFEKGNVAFVGDFYEPEAVLIHKGKHCAYGRAEIVQYITPLAVACDTTFSNERFEATSDHIVYQGSYKTVIKSSGSEAAGKFVQIFRKDGDKWLIIYDEFET